MRYGLTSVLFLLLTTSLAIAQDIARLKKLQEAGSPFLTNYSATVYASHAQNWAILQDHRGVMYFGNSNGVLEYDGVSWRLIPTPNRTFVRSLDVDETGRVFVGAVGDFGCLAADPYGQMQFVSLMPLLAEGESQFTDVWDTHVLNDRIYFLTDDYLFRYTPADVTSGQAAELNGAVSGRVDSWFSENGFHTSFAVHDQFFVREWDTGLLKMMPDSNGNGVLKLVPGGERFATERIYVMLPYDARQILIGTREAGLFLYQNDTFKPFHTEIDQYLQENRLYLPGAMLPNDAIVLGTEKGGAAIIDRDGRLLQIIDKFNGLQNETVSYLYLDREGLLWLALNDGITKVEPRSLLTFFGERAGVEGSLYAIARNKKKLFTATDLGVFYLEPRGKVEARTGNRNRQALFRPVAGISAQAWALLSMKESPDSLLLAATLDGVYRIDQTRARLVIDSPSARSRALALLHSGIHPERVFVGHSSGLTSLRKQPSSPGGWIDEGTVEGVHEEIRRIVENQDGSLWLGTNAQGVLRVEFANTQILSEPQVTRFGTSHGLPSGWIGVYPNQRRPLFTTNRGIYRFNAATNRFKPDSTFGVAFADGSRDIEVVTEDPAGNIWFGSEEAGEISLVKPQPDGGFFWERDPFLRIPRAAINAIYPEPDGVVWIGGYGGLMRYDSSVQDEQRLEFATLIRKVVVKGDSILFGGTNPGKGAGKAPALAYSHNSIKLEFSALSFAVETENSYQTFLEGFDTRWADWSKASWKEYTNLAEGSYRFRVRSQNVYEWIGNEAAFEFSILPPWYRSWWAYVAYALLLGAAVFLVDRFQRVRLIERERENTRIALLEAENRRKTEELEQGRQLQLSMLPEQIPEVDHLEIDVFMKTASEVGGDYYDFYMSEEGTLTTVIGDATGHGLNAGMMVTATKSLFTSLATEKEILQIFHRSNHILRHMHLRRLYMALTLVRIDGYQVEICAAGMPPLLFYHAADKRVEEVLIKAMPLGGVAHFPYQKRDFTVQPGDVLLLMSDGFPERFNEAEEILDYDCLPAVFAEVAHRTPREIIEHFVRVGDEWAGSYPQNDDVTFVVLKFR